LKENPDWFSSHFRFLYILHIATSWKGCIVARNPRFGI
jgi:hypothetical protein